MTKRHEPEENYVEKLEWQLTSELRRHERARPQPRPFGRLVRAAALVAISMAFGAVAMAASQQAEESWRKELLVASLDVRLDLAQRRLEIASEEAQRINAQYEAGAVGVEEMAQVRMFIAEAEAQVKELELQLDEVQRTGRDPVNGLSAPVVDGRDFVGERLQVRLEVLRLRAELMGQELARTVERERVGATDQLNVAAARLAMFEIDSSVETLQKQLEVREQFTEGEITAVEAELAVLQAEANLKNQSMRRQMELAATELERMRRQFEVGTMSRMNVRQAELHMAELEAQLKLAEIEMEALRRRLQERQRQR